MEEESHSNWYGFERETQGTTQVESGCSVCLTIRFVSSPSQPEKRKLETSAWAYCYAESLRSVHPLIFVTLLGRSQRASKNRHHDTTVIMIYETPGGPQRKRGPLPMLTLTSPCCPLYWLQAKSNKSGISVEINKRMWTGLLLGEYRSMPKIEDYPINILVRVD